MFVPSHLVQTSDGRPWAFEGHDRFGLHGSAVMLMQSTGLKDKNGTEIYEGDIIEVQSVTKWGLPYKNQQFPNKRGVVVWQSDRFTIDGVSALNHHVLTYGEVLGNIFENHELLTSKTEANTL